MSGPFGSSQWMYSSGGFYPHELGQSLRFNDDDSAYLSRTPSSAGNRKTWTWSGWVKRGNLTGTRQHIFNAYTGSNSNTGFNALRFQTDNTLQWMGYSKSFLRTNAVFRDTSAWYHIILSVDTTSATGDDRQILYINGERVTALSDNNNMALNTDYAVNSANAHRISEDLLGLNEHFDGYLAEVNFIDGQALDPTEFGEFKSGVWVANEYTGSYGTNGFYLPFTNGIGDDESGNSNDWTANNLAATDIVLDSPTNNFATLNPLDALQGATLSEGNLKVNTGDYVLAKSNFNFSSGKWYFEINHTGSTLVNYCGVCSSKKSVWTHNAADISWYGHTNAYRVDYTSTTLVAETSLALGDIIGVAVDSDTGAVYYYKNNTLVHTDNTLPANELITACCVNSFGSGNWSDPTFNFGQDSSFAGNKTAQGNTDDNGIGDFYYTPPSGYLALCTANLPDPVIDPAQDEVPSDYFNTVTYTGNGSTQSITGVGFQPDFIWLKSRSQAYDHGLVDAVRGVTKFLESNTTDAEATVTNYTTSFDSDGFSLGVNNRFNQSSATNVAWNWLAGNGTSSNTDGSITSTVSVNQKAGFSIVSYTGTNSATETIGHGLGAEPDMIIVKSRESTTSFWAVYHSANTSQPETELLRLNTTDATLDGDAYWNDTAPTSSVFTVGTSSAVNSGNDFIAYCFHSVEGYSKFGSYTGNGSTDGPFVYTGFRPAFVMIKKTNNTGAWVLVDNKRGEINAVDEILQAHVSNAELTGTDRLDIVSNGFKLRTDGGAYNASSDSYIYMAFAENPFKYSNAR